MPILVVGSVALDTVETPFTRMDGVLGEPHHILRLLHPFMIR
ncbi:hypothetical protein [Dictyobacter kobayashii]|nr:hypothetical protein [Dictyobacter kobayashii]